MRCAFCGKSPPVALTLPKRCPSCDALRPYADEPDGAAARADRAERASDVRRAPLARLRSGVDAFDAALSGGLVAGSTLLLAGGEGSGKTSLALRVAASCAARADRPALYASAEQAKSMVVDQAERLGADLSRLFVLATADAARVEAEARRLRACVVVWDSVTRFRVGEHDENTEGAQRRVVWRAVEVATTLRAACILVGHATNEDKPAGPRAVRHDPDGWAWLAGGALTVHKWRFGATPKTAQLNPTATGTPPTPTRSARRRAGHLRLV